MRLTMPSAMTVETAERMSDAPDYTWQEEAWIEKRADEIVKEALDSATGFKEALDSLEFVAWGLDLRDAVMETRPYTSLRNIRRTIEAAAERLWLDDARRQAQQELTKK